MSVASDAAHARVGRAGRAEQMTRSATGALASFAVVQRVGAGAHVLAAAEQLLVAALAEVRGVQRDLAAAPVTDGAPQTLESAVKAMASGVAEVMSRSSGAGGQSIGGGAGAAARPRPVPGPGRGPAVVLPDETDVVPLA